MVDEIQNNENPSNLSENHYKRRREHNPLVVLVILSLLFGMLGGSLSTYYLLRSPSGQRLISQGPGINQTIELTEESAVVDVVKKASPAVVSIIISQDLNKIPGYGTSPYQLDPFYFFFGQPRRQAPTEPNIQQVGAGSGFFVSADGLILTNKHVVDNETASYTVLTSDGKSYDAKVLSRDPLNDLAIMKIEITGAPFLTLADSSKIEIGQRVVAIGNSLGEYQNTVTSGIISGIGRSITAGSQTGSEQLSGVIQTDAAINPGNSGGPLLNSAAQVVGVNTAIDAEGQSVGFALPSNLAQRAITSFQKYGHIATPYLGVRYVLITDSLAKQENLPVNHGALIIGSTGQPAVVSGGPAAGAGLKERDIILEVDGTEVNNKNSLASLLQSYNVGDTVTLKVQSGSETKEIKVTLGEAK